MEANDEHDSDEEDERQHEFHDKSVLLRMENKKKMTEIDLKKIETRILATKYLKSCF